MRSVVQRVSRSSLTVDGAQLAATEHGLVVLAGFAPDDQERDLQWMAEKLAGLRIFPDAEGRMNLSVVDVDGTVLAVPNFTLYGDCRKGKRPSFTEAAGPELATGLFDSFCDLLARAVPVARGVFGAHMHVELVNDGPITLILDSRRAS